MGKLFKYSFGKALNSFNQFLNWFIALQSKVIRVLNLWQKNEVFASEVIQPLFDLANPNSDLSKQMDEQSKRGLISGTGEKSSSKAASIQIAPETQTLTRQPSLQQSDDQVAILRLCVPRAK